MAGLNNRNEIKNILSEEILKKKIFLKSG